MYSHYFGLTEPPFSIAPNPRFLYMSEQHREALAHLLYGINSNGGFVLLTGEVGTGKTTVTRCLLEQLPENTEVALILNPKYTVTELLATICDDLGIFITADSRSLKEYVDRINQHLITNHRHNKNTVLIIDEAQNLSTDVLETVRLLTNLETNTQKLLQIILVGQPELLELLSQPMLRQLNQRITARYHLKALQPDEIQAYINHRLAVAGVDCPLFNLDATKRLYKLTKGVPRLINIICDRALLGAYVQRENTVKIDVLGKAAGEVFGEQQVKKKYLPQFIKPVWSGVLVSVIAGFLIFGYPGYQALISHAQALVNHQTDKTDTVNTFPETPAIAATTADRTEPEKLTNRHASSVTVKGFEEAEQPERQNTDIQTPENTPSDQTDQHKQNDATPTRNVALLTPPQEVEPEAEITGKPAASDPVTSAATPTLSNPANWYWEGEEQADLSKTLAYQYLFELWGENYDPLQQPDVCKAASSFGLSCYFRVSNLDELRRINLPTVIKMQNARGQIFYATISAIDGEIARLYVAEETRYVELKNLELWLSGNFTLFWNPPDGYKHILKPGKKGPEVTWLDKQLAAIQGRAPRQPSPQRYDEALVWQVKKFQTTAGLIPDGVVGPKTLIQLTVKAGKDTPQLTSP
ncbi:ExeA family protein [Aliamphritea hakodatensis]|uniref:ExeA family protein n=1 Tax=Aliamphritea hakodatensis TaxID=2895352 RepID=UPI0022FD8375|nr:ExeA family protein [Aliamphritea hakodatensis]